MEAIYWIQACRSSSFDFLSRFLGMPLKSIANTVSPLHGGAWEVGIAFIHVGDRDFLDEDGIVT